jgi:hypothetical protein
MLQLFKFDMHTVFLLFLIRTSVICSSINKLLQSFGESFYCSTGYVFMFSNVDRCVI